jgi:cytochrome P450
VAGKRSSDQRAALDPSLRERVVGRIEPFVDALDEAVVDAKPETIDDLQEAADELMRAIARVMLELGRSSDLR